MKFSTSALAIALAAMAAPAAAQYGYSYQPTLPTAGAQSTAKQPVNAPNGPKASPKAIKALIALQTAVNARDTAKIPGAIAAAQAVVSTKEDKYLLGQIELNAAVFANDYAGMAAAVDLMASANYLDPKTMASTFRALGSTLYNAKQLDKASAAFERSLTLDPNDATALVDLGETRFSQGRAADAVTYFQRLIQVQSAGGQKPEEAVFKRALAIAYGAKLPVAADISRQWLAAYPSKTSWRNAIALYQNSVHPGTEGTLDLMRLMRATGSMAKAEDYSIYVTNAADQGNYGEAQAVIDEGIAGKMIDPSSALVREALATLKAKPIATEADLATATKQAANTKAYVRIGDGYYGMGKFDKAIELYRTALAKPDVDANIANMHLGMALARAGDKAGAAVALGKVAGTLEGVAQYWLVYVGQPG